METEVMVKIYTKSGDAGTTALGSGERLPKNHLRIEAYGTVDELNSAIGLALTKDLAVDLVDGLKEIQIDLFTMGADLACPPVKEYPYPVPRIQDERVEGLEQMIDRLSLSLPPLDHFILPGGSEPAALLHIARTICRRAERRVVTLQGLDGHCEVIIRYLNRLSDLLFVMARSQNKQDGITESQWIPNK